MKKRILAAMLAASLMLSAAACSKQNETPKDDDNDKPSTEASTDATKESSQSETQKPDDDAKTDDTASGVMSFSDYMAAANDTEVTIETYVQAKQGWWEKDGAGQASFYTQDENGGYFLYNMLCTKEDYDKLTAGTKIKVTGFKSEWSGEVEITDAKFEIKDGNFIAEATDVTSLLGSDALIGEMNKFVSFRGMTVEQANDSGAAYLYNWDGSGSDGDDLYFNVSKDGQTYTFTVESYLCGAGTDVYEAVKALTVGDKIDLEGFLYWYNGANPHITSVKPAAASGAGKSEGVMSYSDYIAAAVDTEVTVETYVQAKQGWWENDGQGVATFYTQDEDGGYFLYNMPCTNEDYEKLIPGTKIKVKGYKSEWSGEVEIIDSTFEIEEGKYIAASKDVTALLGTDKLIDEMNKFVSFKGMTVEESDGGAAFLYNWDGSGADGDDLYFNVSVGGNTYTFTVESYLCGAGTDVYEAVKALKVGDKIDLEGFLYWYNGANPHITAITNVISG